MTRQIILTVGGVVRKTVDLRNWWNWSL